MFSSYLSTTSSKKKGEADGDSGIKSEQYDNLLKKKIMEMQNHLNKTMA